VTRAGRGVLAVVATAVLLAAVAAGGPATAGTPPPSTAPAGSATSPPPVVTSPPASGGVKFSLASQPAWVAAGSSLPLGLQIVGANDGMTVDVVAHQSVDARIRYDRALRGEQLPPVVGQVIRVPLPFLPAADATNGVQVLTLPLQTATDRDPNKLALVPTDAAGVYPVEVSLADADGTQLATFVTPVVVVTPQPNGASAIGEPLNVAWCGRS